MDPILDVWSTDCVGVEAMAISFNLVYFTMFVVIIETNIMPLGCCVLYPIERSFCTADRGDVQ